MSVLKYKDTDGTWKEVASTVNTIVTPGELKVDIITRSSANTYDLTKYADCNRFIMFYTADEIYTINNFLTCVFDSDVVDGRMYKIVGDVNDSTAGLTLLVGTSTKLITLGMADYTTYSAGMGTIPYENVTSYKNGIFTFKGYEGDTTKDVQVGTQAIVIYVD